MAISSLAAINASMERRSLNAVPLPMDNTLQDRSAVAGHSSGAIRASRGGGRSFEAASLLLDKSLQDRASVASGGISLETYKGTPPGRRYLEAVPPPFIDKDLEARALGFSASFSDTLSAPLGRRSFEAGPLSTSTFGSKIDSPLYPSGSALDKKSVSVIRWATANQSEESNPHAVHPRRASFPVPCPSESKYALNIQSSTAYARPTQSDFINARASQSQSSFSCSPQSESPHDRPDQSFPHQIPLARSTFSRSIRSGPLVRCSHTEQLMRQSESPTQAIQSRQQRDQYGQSDERHIVRLSQTNQSPPRPLVR